MDFKIKKIVTEILTVTMITTFILSAIFFNIADSRNNDLIANAESNTVTISKAEAFALASEKLAHPVGTSKSVISYPYGKRRFSSWSQLGKARPSNNYIAYIKKAYGNKNWGWGKGYGGGSQVGASCNFTIGVALHLAKVDGKIATPGNAGNRSTYRKLGWTPKKFSIKKPPTFKRGDIIACYGSKGFHIWMYDGKDKKGNKVWIESAQNNRFMSAHIFNGACFKSNIKSWRSRAWYYFRPTGNVTLSRSIYNYMINNPTTPLMANTSVSPSEPPTPKPPTPSEPDKPKPKPIEKISFSVEKKWIGKSGNEAVVNLFADDVKVDSITLNESNEWKHEFKDLAKYDKKDGHEIDYKVDEEDKEGYRKEITGGYEKGFSITNINTEKITVNVEKRWIGRAKDSITIKLLKDGKDFATAKISKENGWKYEFKDLVKYDEKDGHEIDYTLEEVKTDGYATKITGDSKSGYVVTNTIEGKVSVPVEVKWIGKAADSVKVNLFADGIKIDSVTLDENNNWRYIFPNMEEYMDGEKIKYTVKEVAKDGYTSEIKGNMESGFRIIYTEKIKGNIISKISKITKNPLGKSPETGDTTNIIKYIVILLLAVALVIYIRHIRKRKNKQNK